MKRFNQLGKMLSHYQMKAIVGGNQDEEEPEDGVVPARTCVCQSGNSFKCACSKSSRTCLESCSGGLGSCVECTL